ncbi:MAG TPA: hypothetical protein VEY08_00100 [Chloroflexia bacterium]|nr:hypothetical protein [Chloroflexia bacterium]
MANIVALGRRVVVVLVAGFVVVSALAACQGPTSVTPQAPTAMYDVYVKMDPSTLNPPQLGTLTFGVKNVQTGKPVSEFESVAGALMHNVLIRDDLTYFRHSYTQNLLENEASIAQFWPTTGSYSSYTLYKPAGAEMQVFTTTITSGEASHPGPLVDDSDLMKASGSLRVQLAKVPGPFKAGIPAEFLFHLTERGQPVSGLWPYFGAAGHLWVVNDHGGDFAHLTGAAELRQFAPTSTPGTATPGATRTAQPARTSAPAGSTAVVRPQSSDISDAPTPPPIDPAVAGALATIMAAPQPTFLPIQQTAQVSIVETPAVQPGVGFGPDVIFTHTFEHEGHYKMWLEVMYRGQVSLFDYVVTVEK